MKTIAIIALAGVAGAATAQDVIAYWNQNSNTSPSGFGFEVGDFPQAADFGSGTWDLVNFDATADANNEYLQVDSFSGTTTGALFGDGSGGSFAFRGDSNNGASVVLSFDASSFSDITLDFARRGTSTGYDSVDIGYSIDGGASVVNIVNLAGTIGSSWIAQSFSFGSALDGVANAQIWITYDGATSSSGNQRLDNVTISGIPTPGAAGMLALGGLVAARRRR